MSADRVGGATERAIERAIERAARDSLGRLVAYLAARSGDVAGAQDALADAFAAALAHWPKVGIPDKPEAWLLTAARRKLLDRHRHAGIAAAAAEYLKSAQEELGAAGHAGGVPDERLSDLGPKRRTDWFTIVHLYGGAGRRAMRGGRAEPGDRCA